METVRRIVLGEDRVEKILKRALQHCLCVRVFGIAGCWYVRSASAATREGKFGGSLLKVVCSSKEQNLL